MIILFFFRGTLNDAVVAKIRCTNETFQLATIREGIFKEECIFETKAELIARDKMLKEEMIKKGKFFKLTNAEKRIWYDNDENYKIVNDDLYKNGIFTDDENEIANNI